MTPIFKIIKYFLVWRLLLFVPVILSGFFLVPGSSFPFFEISYYKELPLFLDYPIFKVWSNFDGVHYLSIATGGYTTDARFFPLFPALIFILSLGNISFALTYITTLVFSNIVFVAAIIGFYKLLRLDYPEDISFRAIIMLLIFPTSFFLVSVYSEGLFLLLTLMSFYSARKKRWVFAGLCALLLLSTRLVGICILPALIYEYTNQGRRLKTRDYIRGMGMILVSLLGLLIYSIFNYLKWGNPLYFLAAQGELNNGRSVSALVLPFQTIYRYGKILISLPMIQFEWWVALLEVAAFTFGAIFLFIAWKKKVRTSYLIFGVLAFLLPVLSGTFSGLPRYLLAIFPLFIALGLIKSRVAKILYYAISTILLFLLVMFFSRGHFIA
jgi:hypothetical protein